jgi:hypothetical protein
LAVVGGVRRRRQLRAGAPIDRRRTYLTLRSRVMGVALAAVAAGVCAGTASAATITVANTSDSGPGSLRQAISDAIGGDTIVVPGGTYNLATVLTVEKALTITGAGARSTILDGEGTSRVFSLQSPAAEVTIVGMTIRNGKATNGGGVASQVPLTMTDDAILGNVASGGNGGGLYTGAPFTLERDLFAGNTADGDGGAIEFTPASPFVGTISDSTLTQNTAGGAGGGINDFNSSTEIVHLEGDSLVANSAARGGNFRAWTGTTIDMHNTLIAQGSAAIGPNCAYGGGAIVTSLGYNAQDLNDPNCFLTLPTDQNTINPRLGLLQDNGGQTDTLLPAATSPLVGAGDPSSCSPTDQRGVPRPQAGRCDIGAVERTTPVPGTPVLSGITRSGAAVTATADPGFFGGSYSFRYGTTLGYGSATAPVTLLGATGLQTASASLGGLTAGTTYHVQLVVTAPDGTATSPDVTFTTAGTAPVLAPVLTDVRLSHKRFRVGPHMTAIAASIYEPAPTDGGTSTPPTSTKPKPTKPKHKKPKHKTPKHKKHGRKKRAPAGTAFQFTLSDLASVRIEITGKVKGLRHGHRCVVSRATPRHGKRKPSHQTKPAKACVASVTRALTRAKVPRGEITIPFSGRIGAKAMRPGTYTARVSASNGGGTAAPVKLTFTIVK